VVKVVTGSVADKTGLTKGDLIQSAAGFGIGTTRALVEIVQRQAPGTWLPLTVLRGDESLEYFARFPQSFE
jgi:S1-C subfamily serine protease